MKQKTRMTALCTAAVLMALGASMTAFGAQGWAKEGDVWTYVDSRGDRVTDSWRKSGNYWYYLDSNGEMLTDQWVDDTYYVDVNGVMITNRWLYVNPGTDDAPNSDGGCTILTPTERWRQTAGRPSTTEGITLTRMGR